jgi:dUTP pyrophosphatase
MQQYTLLIKPNNNEVASYYQNHSSFHTGDSGFDLFITEDVTFGLWETKFVDLKIQCEMLNPDGHNVSYYLYPRSSISKTPLILCNHVGIIDSCYRGNLIAALKFIPNYQNDQNDLTYTLKKGTRIVQICSPTLIPLNHKLVDVLSETERGNNGFGSTGL